MSVLLCVLLCAGRFGLGWAHDEFIIACHMFMHSHAYVPSIVYILIYQLLGTFLIVPLPFFLSLLLTLVVSWHLRVSPLCPRTLFVPKHLLPLFLLTPLPLPSGSVMRRPNQLLDFYDIDLSTVIYSQGWESLYGASITCPSVII